MSNNVLSLIAIIVSVIGVLLAIFVSIAFYYRTKRNKKAYSYYALKPLANTDVSIMNAVDYLKIVNVPEDFE